MMIIKPVAMLFIHSQGNYATDTTKRLLPLTATINELDIFAGY